MSTLLEKARTIAVGDRRRKTLDVDELEKIELALEFLRGNVKANQVAFAIGSKSSPQTSARLYAFSVMRDAIKSGAITVTVNK